MFVDKLDSMTLAFSMILLQLIYILGFGIASFNNKQKYVQKIAIGVLIMAFGYLSVSVGKIPFINVFMASSFLAFGYSVMAFGFCDLVKGKVNYKIFSILVVNHILIYSYLTFINPIFNIRTSFFSFEIVLVAMFIAHLSFNHYKKSNDSVALFISFGSILKAYFHLWRIYAIMREINPETLFRDAHMAKYVHIATILYNSCFCICTILLATRIQLSKMKEMNDHLTELSYRDSLTHTFNLRYLLQKFEEELKKIGEKRTTMSLAIIDIDYFKKINDTCGHVIGDEVLIKMTKLINENISKTDIFGRYGGEEFILIMPNRNLKTGVELVQKLQKVLKADSWIYDDLHITFSSGVIEINYDNYRMEAKHLINEADEFLYIAKRNGRDRVEYLR